MTVLRHVHIPFRWHASLLFALLAFPAMAQFPPLTTEISAEHPLFLFPDYRNAGGATEAYASQIITDWQTLPEQLKPLSILQMDTLDADAGAQHNRYLALMPGLQAAAVPVVIRVSKDATRPRYLPGQLDQLLAAHTNIAGVEASGIDFNRYDPHGTVEAEIPPQINWLLETIDVAARYGRFVLLPMEGLQSLRMMCNESSAPLHGRLREVLGYVLPIAEQRGPNTVLATSAVSGLWLEGAVGAWGIRADARWYHDANFLAPGVYGMPPAQPAPGHPLRAMILNGAMLGATVYSFGPEDSLWFGANGRHFEEYIWPTLREVLDLGLIARMEFVTERTKAAYKLQESKNPLEVHANLRDLDPIHDAGLMLHAAYGIYRPAQMPELILNRGDQFWIPVVSAYAPEPGPFAQVFRPDPQRTLETWAEQLAPFSSPAGEGAAFMTRVGRGVFVMNTHENLLEAQQFLISELPAPVRGVEARREAAGVSLTWPQRPGDVSFSVYRRVGEERGFSILARALDAASYADTTALADSTITYAVTALTSDMEPYSGTVQYGQYLALSGVESRIEEVVVLTPALAVATSAAPPAALPAPEATVPWWPSFNGVPEQHLPLAQAIVARIEQMDAAIVNEQLDALLDAYSTDYGDAQGWRLQYVRRAFQWLFERYMALHMDRQLRAWDFTAYETAGQVSLLMYCRIRGTALSDGAGIRGDIDLEIPRTENSEVTLTWALADDQWRIVRTSPALPNMRDIMSVSMGPFDSLAPGPDIFAP